MKPPSNNHDAERILDDLRADRKMILVILFIPSHDRDEKELKNQDFWADAALDLFADLFGGATAFQSFAGVYRDKSRNKDLKDKPILLQSYTDIDTIYNINTLINLTMFMKRLGKETKQAAVAVVINNIFIELSDY